MKGVGGVFAYRGVSLFPPLSLRMSRLIELHGRWKEALLASRTHPQGDRIVPRVNLRGTSLTALGEGKGKVTMEELERFKE